MSFSLFSFFFTSNYISSILDELYVYGFSFQTGKSNLLTVERTEKNNKVLILLYIYICKCY